MKKIHLSEKLYILDEENYYKILDIEENSSLEKIHKAYKELAISLHPDRNTDLSGKEKEKLGKVFSKITAAYNLLKVDDNRKKYDAELKIKRERQELIKSLQEEKIQQKEEEKISIRVSEAINNRKAENSEEGRKNRSEEFFKIGVLKLNKNDLDGAIEYLKKATEIYYNIAKYHSYLGLAMEKKGWNGYAQAEFKIALNYDKFDSIANKYHTNNIDNKEKIGIMSRIRGLFK